jgi:hypothetical protein
MKVLTLHQPWASLLMPFQCRACAGAGHIGPATGADPREYGRICARCVGSGMRPLKTIETRPNAFPSLVGQRIAIHAAARNPWTDRMDAGERAAAMMKVVPRDLAMALRGGGIEYPLLWSSRVPLGVIVGTALVAACLPMIEMFDDVPAGPFIYVDADFVQIHEGPDDGAPRYLEDERAFGDFGSGRHGLVLVDAKQLPEPVPFKGGQGLSKSWEPA